MRSHQPIGIFDSGIGGLTVARAVKRLLPREELIYFGDTAHLPYGEKSTAAIQSYAIKICDLLLKHNCKVVLIACNSASAAAYDLLKEYAGSRATVMNVIDPMVNHIREKYSDKKIGLIATRQTVNSHIYQKKIDGLGQGIDLRSLATPLLVSMIEEGFFNNKLSEGLVAEYLGHDSLKDIDALILGCTHFPLISKEINDYYGGKVEILDSSAIVARSLKAWLEMGNLLNNGTEDAIDSFYVSDFTESFQESTKIFYQREVNLQLLPLWE